MAPGATRLTESRRCGTRAHNMHMHMHTAHAHAQAAVEAAKPDGERENTYSERCV